MAIKHKKIVNKKQRARDFADRLKNELELERCTPILTQKRARQFGERLRRNDVGFYLESAGTGVYIRLNSKLFFSPILGEGDELYFFRLVTKLWLEHLQVVAYKLMQGASD